MGNIAWLEIVIVGSVGFLSAAFALVILSFFKSRMVAGAHTDSSGDNTQVFVFDGSALVDVSDAARHWLEANAVPAEDEYDRVMDYLARDFGADVPEKLVESAQMTSLDGQALLRARSYNDALRIEVERPPQRESSPVGGSVQSLERELETLRTNSENLPFVVWRETAQGEISWINTAYLETVKSVFGEDVASQWPPVALFDTRGFLTEDRSAAEGRITVRRPDAEQRWFDCHAKRIGSEVLFCAANAGPAVQAETQLREFTQTLVKTFSHLTVGLAIFDQKRRLKLFNPALCDLTSLSAEFLTARPTLFGFLDELREAKMIPEPKDYQNWRTELAALEEAATSGDYHETWSLPSGQTYRVSGRPHPDGSVAFLFDDISSEISLTRRFRAELELNQAVVDAIPDAVAVFSRSGTLTMTNAAFIDFWGRDPGATMSAPNVNDLTKLWYEHTAPTPIWGDFREFCLSPGGRAEWTADCTMRDGRAIACRFAPLPAGSTIAVFSWIETQQTHSSMSPEKASA